MAVHNPVTGATEPSENLPKSLSFWTGIDTFILRAVVFFM